jgi:beta-glucanase (GH16 family)
VFNPGSVIISLASIALFAGMARPVTHLESNLVTTAALPAAIVEESDPVAAARKITVGQSKRVPGLGPAFGQVDATLPGPRPNDAAPTTTAGTPKSVATAPKPTEAPTTKPAGVQAPAPTTPSPTPTTTLARPTTTPATTTTRAAAVPTGWQTIFVDNFDGGTVDASRWTVENRPATNMGEISFYAADDVFIRDGAMIVRAQNRPMGGRSFTSGQAVTKFDFQYGRVEIRAKMPKGQGFWPALWMLPSDGSTSGWLPEIDIYESINNESRYFGNHHFPSGSGQSQLGPVPVNTDTTAWHVYGFDWTPQSLTWTLDGQPVVSTTNVDATNQHRMFLLITFALGGSWPGPPDGSTPWPSEMQIDYVKVLQQV